jgi:hypothetical protein
MSSSYHSPTFTCHYQCWRGPLLCYLMNCWGQRPNWQPKGPLGLPRKQKSVQRLSWQVAYLLQGSANPSNVASFFTCQQRAETGFNACQRAPGIPSSRLLDR